MVIKVSIPNRFQFKTVPSFRTMLFQREGEVHYIGGADILPAPLDNEEEARLIEKLGTEEEGEARSALIEHNLRLVVYIAKKFDNTSVGVEDLISIGAYKAGTNPKLDVAISKIDKVNEFLMQKTDESFSVEESLRIMRRILQ